MTLKSELTEYRRVRAYKASINYLLYMLQNLNKRVDNHACMLYNKNMEQTSNQHGHQSDGHETSKMRIFNVTNCNNIPLHVKFMLAICFYICIINNVSNTN